MQPAPEKAAALAWPSMAHEAAALVPASGLTRPVMATERAAAPASTQMSAAAVAADSSVLGAEAPERVALPQESLSSAWSPLASERWVLACEARAREWAPPERAREPQAQTWEPRASFRALASPALVAVSCLAASRALAAPKPLGCLLAAKAR